LQHYSWPGNVRELGNLVERLSILFPGLPVEFDDLPRKYQIELPEGAQLVPSSEVSATESIQASSPSLHPEHNTQADPKPMDEKIVIHDACNGAEAVSTLNLEEGLDLKSYLVEMEVKLIQKALLQTEGNVSQAAKLLQTNRTTLVEKIRKYDLT